jgi:lipopolysaccharide transport system ATP-binding protein
MSAVIKVESLSKQYRLGQVGTGTISHDVNRWWHKIRGKEDPYLKIGESNDRTVMGSSDYVWALKDINFEVKQGEVLGIIGRNGAGKSTLLKILSRTTSPTTGSVKIKGRVASLLEVGTGFHPELSGRDNIFLNGAILGMTRREIQSKFEEIVDFAGVERYIDTPVKRYSSGMYVRLAFAVAAHLEPEILIVDEVLAVGDAEFQKKCLGKMKDVSVNQGRTVLFVSHNMEAIQELSLRSILLDFGSVIANGQTLKVIDKYLNNDRELVGDSDIVLGEFDLNNHPSRLSAKSTCLKKVKLFVDNTQTGTLITNKKCRIDIELENQMGFKDIVLGLVIKNKFDTPIIGINNKHYNKKLFGKTVNEGTISIEFDYFPIYGDGKYNCDLFLGNDEGDYETVFNAFHFYVVSFYNSSEVQKINPSLNQFYFRSIGFINQ